MATMQVEVVSAERRLFKGEATEVYARSLDGEIGILPGHQPALLALDVAPVRIKTEDGQMETVAVHQGFLYFRDNRLVVLANQAELLSEIDAARAQEDVRRLQEQLNREDDAEARAELRRATLRTELTGRT